MSYPLPIDPIDLFALPLEEFTAARNALAKELTAAGDKAGAAQVKALKKPSRAAWVLNQLAREHPGDVSDLREAGGRLRAAQDAALRGDASTMRDANRAVADLVESLAERAGSVTTAVRDAIVSTLRAAAVDEAAGELLARGTLVAEVDPTGFGLEGVELPPEIERKTREPEGPDPHLVAEAERAEARANRLLEAAAAAETRAQEARLAADQAVADAGAARQAVSRRSTGRAARP
ncbi:MAG TPA: hypothetical protein VFB78_18670 [Acidimicrobiales bacterium]|nr:hypothetical protein [Acidimicrobiales bacterium]